METKIRGWDSGTNLNELGISYVLRRVVGADVNDDVGRCGTVAGEVPGGGEVVVGGVVVPSILSLLCILY
jgi:hypothetical protein